MISFLHPDDAEKIGFYNIINKYTGEVYSGSGILGRCWYRHYYGYCNKNHDNIKLQEAFNRTPDGWEFLPVAIDNSNLSKSEIREIAYDLEQNDLDNFMNHPLFLNISTNARVCRPIGIKATEETRKKQSQTHITRFEQMNEEEKQKIKDIGLNNLSQYINYVKNNGVPESVKQKQSFARHQLFANGYISPNKGVIYSDERKEQMSNIGKSIWENLSEEEKVKRTTPFINSLVGNKHTLGRKQPREEIEKRIIANTGKKRDDDSKQNISNGIRAANGINFTIDGVKYNCYSDAAKQHDVSTQTVINRLNSQTERFKNWSKES